MDPTTVAQTLAAYARPARPVTPTPTSQDDIAQALYGDATALPSWIPQNVQNYINQTPSYAEGQSQGAPRDIASGEPYSSTPQIADIQRLFRGSITRNAPTSNGMSADQLRKLYAMPGFSGFSGGDEI